MGVLERVAGRRGVGKSMEVAVGGEYQRVWRGLSRGGSQVLVFAV